MTQQTAAAIREKAERIKLTAGQITGIADFNGMDGFAEMGTEIQTSTAAILLLLGEAEKRPEIVCLCGSTRFYDAFQRSNYELTMQGKIVLTVGFYPHSQEQAHGQAIGCTPEQKATLDELHKRKIDLADKVLVLNVGGYIGESTRSEIAYAIAHRKPVDYLEMTADGEMWREGGAL
jgi:hypothetical protein